MRSRKIKRGRQEQDEVVRRRMKTGVKEALSRR